MLLNLFNEMRAAKVPVSVRELLDLINALKHHVVFADMDEFYYLARTVMVKDERHFDKFDRAFGAYFNGLQNLNELLEALIPEDWLRKEFERLLTDEEREQIQSLGGLDKLIEEFKKRLEEQKERHAGGNKWIGTGGTSPFGSGGYNPMGVRVGDAGKRQGRAAKVWVVTGVSCFQKNGDLRCGAPIWPGPLLCNPIVALLFSSVKGLVAASHICGGDHSPCSWGWGHSFSLACRETP